MIEQSGKVVAVEQGIAWVQTIQTSACSSCSARSGCGASVLDKLSGGKVTQLPLTDCLGVSVGETITIGVPDDALLKASFLVYFLPLLSLMLMALVADWIWPDSELHSIGGGIIGLLAGFMLVKRISASTTMALTTQPVMLKKGGAPDQVDSMAGLDHVEPR